MCKYLSLFIALLYVMLSAGQRPWCCWKWSAGVAPFSFNISGAICGLIVEGILCVLMNSWQSHEVFTSSNFDTLYMAAEGPELWSENCSFPCCSPTSSAPLVRCGLAQPSLTVVPAQSMIVQALLKVPSPGPQVLLWQSWHLKQTRMQTSAPMRSARRSSRRPLWAQTTPLTRLLQVHIYLPCGYISKRNFFFCDWAV